MIAIGLNGRTGMGTAALLAAVGLGLIGAQTPTMAAAPMSELAKLAAAGGLHAFDAMLDLRSPGLRMPGALTQTKALRVVTLKEYFGPKERVLGKERTRPNGPGHMVPDQPDTVETVDYVTPGLPVVPTGGAGTPPDDTSMGGGGTPYTSTGGFGVGFGGGPIIFGGGGGGGSGTGGGDTPVVGSAVPEPATWLTLIVGFLAIGFGLRGGASGSPARRVLSS